MTQRLAGGPGELRQLVEEEDAVVGQYSSMFLEARSWVSSGRLLLGAPSTASRLSRIVATCRWSGPRAASPISSARSSCSPAPSKHDRRSGWTLRNRRPDTTRTPPGQPSKVDTWLGLLDGASGHQGGRPPRPTAWPDARSSGRVQSSIRAGWPGSTNDERLSPHWTAVRPGVRVVSSCPGRECPSRPPWCA